jgi:hypothetical protein
LRAVALWRDVQLSQQLQQRLPLGSNAVGQRLAAAHSAAAAAAAAAADVAVAVPLLLLLLPDACCHLHDSLIEG